MKHTVERLTSWIIVIGLVAVGLVALPAKAQRAELVAQLQVEKAGVTVQRVNTGAWRAVQIESLVGVGDRIQTDATGLATISLAGDVVRLQLQPNTMAEIVTSAGGDAGGFEIVTRVEGGFATATARAELDDQKRYTVETPGFKAQMKFGRANLRIEANGRSAVLASAGSTLQAVDSAGARAGVEGGQGLRADSGGALSEVIPADTFPVLDIGLDGCPSTLLLTADVEQNVRAGADLKYAIIGRLADRTPVQVMGRTTALDWTRIRFRDGYGWITVTKAQLPLEAACVGLRLFIAGFAEPGPAGAVVPTATPKP